MKNGRHLHFWGGHSKVFGGWKCERVRSTTDLVVAQNEAVFPGGVTLRGGCLISHTWRVWTKHWVDFDKLPTGEFTGFQPYKTVWNSEGSIRKMVVYQESGHFSPTSTLNSARWFPAFRGRGKLSILRKKCQIRRKWKSTNGFHWGKKPIPICCGFWICNFPTVAKLRSGANSLVSLRLKSCGGLEANSTNWVIAVKCFVGHDKHLE